MKLSLLALFSIIILIFSCRNKPGENTSIKTTSSQPEPQVASPEFLEMCDTFWERRYPSEGTKKMYLEKILSEEKLTENNKKFISALMSFPSHVLAPQKPVYPIFRLSESHAGIFAFPEYDRDDDSFQDISAENSFIQKFTEVRKDHSSNDSAEHFFPALVDELLEVMGSPEIFYYSLKERGESRIENFGVNYGECFNYYTYLLPQNEKITAENLLFGSQHKIDLVYENYPQIDSLLSAQNKNECLDCPASFDSERTFARLKGTDNVYFVFADTFPINDQLDAPSRGIVYLNQSNEVGYLWYEEIDLFGCSCL